MDEDNRKGKDENQKCTVAEEVVEHPGSETEVDMEVNSGQEEELLKSPEGSDGRSADTEAEAPKGENPPRSPPHGRTRLDPEKWAALKEKLKAMKKAARKRKRQQERAAAKEQRESEREAANTAHLKPEQGNPITGTPALNSPVKASTGTKSQPPTAGQSTSKGGQAIATGGRQRSEPWQQVGRGRGPRARDARRQASRPAITLPEAPRSVRGYSEREVSKHHPDHRTKTTSGPEDKNKKRKGSNKSTPPGKRPPKKAREETSHVSPLLRTQQQLKQPGPLRKGGQGSKGGSYSAAARRELQAVVLSDRSQGVIEPQEAEILRQSLIHEMLLAMRGPEGGPRGPELRFENSGLTESGWLRITAEDETTQKWLLESWKPKVVGKVSFRVMRSADAPWPERIGFWLRTPEVNLGRITEMLSLQNRDLQVESWRHAETRGEQGDWHLTFLVSGETVRNLETRGWRLNYELIRLSVRRITVWGGASRPSTSRADDPQRPKEGEKEDD